MSDFEESEISNENVHNFLCFCSLICLINGKKLNLPNIFLLLLNNDAYKALLKHMLTIDNDFDLFKFFIDYESSISKSKYISKYLNSTQGIKVKKDVYGFRKSDIQRAPKRVKKRKKPAVQAKKRLLKS
jgi:pantothenate kinase